MGFAVTDISERLAGPQLLTGAAATVYTVPALTKAQIVHIKAHNTDTVAVDLTVSIGADALGTRIYDQLTLGELGGYESILDDTTLYVLDAGEIIQAFASTTGVIVLSVHGVETT